MIEQKKTEFNLGGYINVRKEDEQKLIKMCIDGESFPTIEKRVVETKSDSEEMKEMKALLVK